MEQISYKIVAELQKNDAHIRELAKVINTNHMAVLRKLKELEDQNVVDFKQQGKNKSYYLKESLESKQVLLMLEHYKLLQLVKKHLRLRKITEYLQTKNVDLAMIFGSYAKGTETSGSDIDIYVDVKSSNLKKELELMDSKISVKMGEFDKESLLTKEIIKNHVIIKGVEKFYEFIHQKTG